MYKDKEGENNMMERRTQKDILNFYGLKKGDVVKCNGNIITIQKDGVLVNDYSENIKYLRQHQINDLLKLIGTRNFERCDYDER